MHPNAAFRFKPDDPALAFVAGAWLCAYLRHDARWPARRPCADAGDAFGRSRFHLAKMNALAKHLDGEPVLASIGGPGSYVSPNWYADPAASVPTWNYRTVEIEGQVRAMTAEELEELLDLSSATFEPRVGEGWTMAKMLPARAEAMMRSITGFELTPTIIRSTDKASQNRSEADARGIVAAMEALGDIAGAAAIRRTRGW